MQLVNSAEQAALQEDLHTDCMEQTLYVRVLILTFFFGSVTNRTSNDHRKLAEINFRECMETVAPCVAEAPRLNAIL